MISKYREGVTRYGIPIIALGMIAAGLGYYANPAVARWVIMPVVVVVILVFLTRVILQSARGTR